MKTFKICSAHDVYIDDYAQGELDRVNGYTVKNEIQANDAWEAIKKYFETTLYYDFKKDNASKSDEVENELHYSVLVDIENLEASENQIEKWKQGKEKLYSNNITITVYEIIGTVFYSFLRKIKKEILSLINNLKHNIMAIYTHEETDGNLINNSAKKDLIEDIKEILNNYGHFHIGEVDADCSPFLDETKGNLTHLIEYFSKGYCEVNVYCEKMGDDKIDSYYLNYEELSESNLAEILDICERYKEIQEENN